MLTVKWKAAAVLLLTLVVAVLGTARLTGRTRAGQPEARAGAAPPAQAPGANARARREAARKVYEGTLARMKVDVNAQDFDRPCQWSRRWLEAERELAPAREDRAAAARAHLDRMTDLEALVRKLRDKGVATDTDLAVVEFYRLEAERWWAEAGGAVP
jgi:hypothetical protein